LSCGKKAWESRLDSYEQLIDQCLIDLGLLVVIANPITGFE